MNNPAVSVIIVNYNSLALISDCIDSIKTFTSVPFEIIIVSNSHEELVEIQTVKEKLPSINYIESGSNLGFSKANNIGANHAKGKYLFFLNPDTVLLNNAIDLLHDKIDQTPEIGLIGPAIFDSEGNQEPSVVGHISSSTLFSLAFPFLRFFLPPKHQEGFYSPNSSEFVDVVHGSSMMISSKLYNEVEGMDEDFFLYSEERDLCLKVAKTDHKVLFFNEAKVEHIGGGASENLFLPLEIEKHRSKKKLIRKNYPQLVILNKFCGILGYGFRTIFSVLTFNRFKIQQFGTLFYWYLFIYK